MNLGLIAENGSKLMEPEEALYWRMLISYFHSEAQAKGHDAAITGGAQAAINAAAAGEKNELLDRILPATIVDYVELVKAHLNAGPHLHFVSRQLLLMGKFLDFSDATSGKVAAAFLQDLIRMPAELGHDESELDDEVLIGDGLSLGGDRHWAKAVAELARKVHGTPREFERTVAEVVDRDVISWNVLIAGFVVDHGFYEEAINYTEQMRTKGVPVSSITFVSGLKACGCITDLERGHELHSEIIIRGMELEIHVANTLVDMYVKCSSIAEAQKVSDKFPGRNVISWTSLIAGYVENRLGHEALKCLEQIQQEGITLNVNTVVCSLKPCGAVGALDKGHEIHAELRKLGFDTDRTVGNTLVDMYSNCGSLLDGRKAFDKLPFHMSSCCLQSY